MERQRRKTEEYKRVSHLDFEKAVLRRKPLIPVPPRLNHAHHLRLGRVNEPEGCDIRPPILEVIQVDQVEVEVGDEVVVVGSHHAHRLSLLQHRPDLLVIAIEDNVDLSGLFHFLEDQLVVVVVLEVELLDNDPGVVLMG